MRKDNETDCFRVAVLLNPGYASRTMINGVLRYRHAHPHFLADIREQESVAPGEISLTKGHFDGVIGNLFFVGYRHLMRALNIPAVFIQPDVQYRKLPARVPWYSYLYFDNNAIVTTILDYLTKLGATSFAYVGFPPNPPWSQERAQALRQSLARQGLVCHVYPQPSGAARNDFAVEQSRLGAWLKRLPPRTAVIAANDLRAEQVLSTCLRYGLQVPRDLLVIGVDNDEERCLMSVPHLSSVALAWDETGWRAAEALNRVMRERRAGLPLSAPFVISTAAPRVVPRESTNERLSTDLLVRRALDLIHDAHGVGVTTRTLARRLNVCDRVLQRHFIDSLSRTPSDEINRTRLDYLKTLLRDPALTRTSIAERGGFASNSHLAYFFRLHTGMTIAAYRATLQTTPQESR